MNAPKRLTLVERLQIAKAAHALALERAGALRERVRVTLPPPEDRSVAIEAARKVERSPLHVCGVRMVLCVSCDRWVCRAPGHPLHVCKAPEFTQEAAP